MAPAWIRRPHWWPPIGLLIVLASGLIVIAVQPDSGATEPVRFYTSAERPAPLPEDQTGSWLVDLNHASRAELVALPQIGPGLAQALMDARAESPFASLRDVVDRGVLSRSVAAGLADIVGVSP